MFTNINALQGTLCLQNMSKAFLEFYAGVYIFLMLLLTSTNSIQILYKSNPIQIEDLYWVRFVKSF